MARGRVNRLLRLHTWLDGQYVTTYAADGLLVSTPTGSTGSNLAAHGPVLPPDMEALILAPVMPFISFPNPIVLPASSRLDVQVVLTPPPPQHDAVLFVDSGTSVTVQDGDRIGITGSDVRARFARVRQRHYFHAVLVAKLQRAPIEPPLPPDTPSPDGSPGEPADQEQRVAQNDPMLQELAIRNFALLEAVQIPFGAGLNVLTGETGAGKSIIIDALGAVLGGRITTEAIRTGSDRALVEAIFALPGGEGDPLRQLLEGLGLEGSLDGDSHDPGGNGQAGAQDEGGEPALILARELSRSGRSVARVNGRTVPVSTLAQIGALLVDIHGQHEHLSLLRPEAQRDLLDHFGALQPRRSELAALVREWRAVRAEWRSLQQDEREAARRIDLLSFQIEEIGNARLQPGEEETLQRERTLLVNAARPGRAGDGGAPGPQRGRGRHPGGARPAGQRRA